MLEERPGNPLRVRYEQSLTGEYLDQRGVRELREIDRAAIVHTRSVSRFRVTVDPNGFDG